jgi:tetratricopeptide (TPR) repeat protein
MIKSMLNASPEVTDVHDAFGSDTLTAMVQLAARYYRHGLPEHAAQVYTFLVRHDPTEPRHYLALGKAEHAQGLYERAVQSYSRAIRLGLADAHVHFYIGQCLIFLDRLPIAEQAFEACLRIAAAARGEDLSLISRAQLMLVRVQKQLKRIDTGLRPA